MDRHRIHDVGGRGTAANARLLANFPAGVEKRFDEVRQILTKLPEDVAAEGFRQTMHQYLSLFLRLVELR